MRILVDTGDAVYTGNKIYHLWVMSQCPIIVTEYLQYDLNTKYDVVQLLVALDLNIT